MDANLKTEPEARQAEELKRNQGPVTLPLKDPVEWGSTVITELTLRPTAAAFRGFSIRRHADGGFDYQPHALAVVGVGMAGKPEKLADKLSVRDMLAIAEQVMLFFGPSQTDGRTPSP